MDSPRGTGLPRVGSLALPPWQRRSSGYLPLKGAGGNVPNCLEQLLEENRCMLTPESGGGSLLLQVVWIFLLLVFLPYSKEPQNEVGTTVVFGSRSGE